MLIKWFLWLKLDSIKVVSLVQSLPAASRLIEVAVLSDIDCVMIVSENTHKRRTERNIETTELTVN